MSGRLGLVVGPTFLRISVALFVFLVSAECALAVGGQSRGDRQSQEKAARKACLTGDYATGVSILADLFVERKDPIYIFNQGRCLEQNSRYKDAISRFEEFLRMGETSTLNPDDRASGQKHIDDCKAKLPAEDKPKAGGLETLVQPMAQATPLPPADPTTQIVLKPKGEPELAKNGKGLVLVGIATGSVGVASVIAGVFLNLKANSLVDEMETTVDSYTSDRSSTQKTYQSLAWVGYGVGAACIVTGAALIAIGASRNDSAVRGNVAIVPAVGPGQTGLVLRGGF
jgi:hypothetical protein